MSVRIALKRLAEVEVVPGSSNQHEFNAGRLRTELGFRPEKVSGKIEFIYYEDDATPPLAWTEEYTIYDCRTEQKHRRPEWRLYYSGARVAENARSDDLLAIFRPSTSSKDLVAVIVRAGSEIERALTLNLANAPPEAILRKLTFFDSGYLDAGAMQLVLGPVLQPATDAYVGYDYGSHPVFERAVSRRRMPSTKEMAAAAQSILIEVDGADLTPDEFIDRALSTESGLFFAIEDTIGNLELKNLKAAGGADFAGTMRLVQSYVQSRRSRRGESLENHFRKLLEVRRIPHQAQCQTEPGRTPDFVIPGYAEYHDAGFPEERLRMVGCKTIVRERHAQWVTEAARIEIKYGLCVDDGLSERLINNYEGKLRFFMPSRLIGEAYAGKPSQHLLGSVADLVADLEAVTESHV